MVMTGKAASLTLLVLAIIVGLGESAPIWSYLFGPSTNKKSEPAVKVETADKETRRTFDEIRGVLPNIKHKHHDSESKEYNTYYVKIPPAHPSYEEDQRLYDHADGVDVWELPSIWDGNFVVPNIIPESKPKEHHDGKYHDDEIKEDDKRVVKGWDNRWGFRLAIPYVGDFQYLREMGPGDFVPKLGPGRFEYPGPGEVDDPGHKQYEKYPEYIKPKPIVPVIDLTEYQGLQNYPWYTR